jgi:uncharacterized membrane protein YhaH (DUF805 family)
MTFGAAIRSGFRNYAAFTGRAGRSEFWWFQLPWLIIGPFLPLSAIILLASVNRNGHLTGDAVLFFPFFRAAYIVIALYLLAVAVPTLAMVIRRLHDTGRSGWWVWITLVPFGGLVLVIFLIERGTDGPNRFGPDPLIHTA